MSSLGCFTGTTSPTSLYCIAAEDKSWLVSPPPSSNLHRSGGQPTIHSTTACCPLIIASPTIFPEGESLDVAEDGVEVVTAVHEEGVEAEMVGGAVSGAGRQPLGGQLAGHQRPRVAHIVLNRKKEGISVADPGCLPRIPDPTFFIPDPIFFHPGSQILIKELNYFNPKKMVSKL